MQFWKKLNDFHCQQCGRCCLELGSSLISGGDEAEKWLNNDEIVPSNFGRRYFTDFIDYFPETGGADLWFHPDTKEELDRCPFLRKTKSGKYRCLIHDKELRPNACKEWPYDFEEDRRETCPEVRRIVDIQRRINE